MFYVPSPIRFSWDLAFQAMTNKSGRMQYYKIRPSKTRERVTRADFIEAYNNSKIIAVRPLPSNHVEMAFQFEFFISVD